MIERLLGLVTVADSAVPRRVCGLIAQRAVDISSIQLTRDDDERWTVHLLVRVENEAELKLVIARLTRLIDVIKVIDVGSEPHHQRRSVFVWLRPAVCDVIDVGEIARLFAAEILQLTPAAAMLHLAASPERCAHFVSMLEPYTVVDVVYGAVSGVAASARFRRPGPGSGPTVETLDHPKLVPLAAERRRA